MFQVNSWRALGILAALLLITTACRARDEPSTQILGDTTPPQPLPPATARLSDDNIVALLSHANLTEINTARAAHPRAASRDVREFAQRVIDEHTAMQQALDSLARAKNIPTQAPERQEVVTDVMAVRANALLSAPDAAFDTAYVHGQLAIDAIFLEDVTRLAAAATDEDLRRLLRSWMPMTQARVLKGVGLLRQLEQ